MFGVIDGDSERRSIVKRKKKKAPTARAQTATKLPTAKKKTLTWPDDYSPADDQLTDIMIWSLAVLRMDVYAKAAECRGHSPVTSEVTTMQHVAKVSTAWNLARDAQGDPAHVNWPLVIEDLTHGGGGEG